MLNFQHEPLSDTNIQYDLQDNLRHFSLSFYLSTWLILNATAYVLISWFTWNLINILLGIDMSHNSFQSSCIFFSALFLSLSISLCQFRIGIWVIVDVCVLHALNRSIYLFLSVNSSGFPIQNHLEISNTIPFIFC